MDIKRVLFLSILNMSFLATGAIPQAGARASDDPMKLKRRANTGIVLKDRGTDFKIAPTKGKPGPFTPQLALHGAESIKIGGKPYSWISFFIVNWSQFPAGLFKPAPGLPPCGKNNNSSRTWLAIYNSDTNAYVYGYCAMDSPAALKDFGFAVPEGQFPPKQVYVVLTDRQTNTVYQSNCINAWSGVGCAKP